MSFDDFSEEFKTSDNAHLVPTNLDWMQLIESTASSAALTTTELVRAGILPALQIDGILEQKSLTTAAQLQQQASSAGPRRELDSPMTQTSVEMMEQLIGRLEQAQRAAAPVPLHKLIAELENA